MTSQQLPFDGTYVPPGNDDPLGFELAKKKLAATITVRPSAETRAAAPTLDVESRPRNPVEIRSAETVDVRFPDRTVTLRAMPYEVPTYRVVREGRQITEIVSPGAFNGCERRKDVRAYRNHDKTQTVGRATGLFPDRPDGLIAQIKVANTYLGDETLELAADHLLDASVGFAPVQQRWSADRSERRIVSAYLDHIAFVGDPAYETANVLDVRRSATIEVPSVSVATPNKDAIIAKLRAMGYPSPLGPD